jgi:Zn-dependent peptidase ImmA (M78 family)
VEQYIWWKRDLYKIIVGQNITRAQDKFTMAHRLLHGDALAIFGASTIGKDETKDDDFEMVMRGLAAHVFPKNALATQKAWLR